MKYQNIIFDLGNVVILFDPEYIIKKHVNDKEDIALLSEVVFERKIWDKLDIGSITDDECKAEFRLRLPDRLKDAACKIYDDWIISVPEIDGIRELIMRIKAQGCRVFALSNISKYFSQNREKNPILTLFDGVVLSADIHMAKPNPEIFRYICNKYSIEPEKSLFIDDKQANIDAAKNCGLNTWLFKFDVKELSEHVFQGDSSK